MCSKIFDYKLDKMLYMEDPQSFWGRVNAYNRLSNGVFCRRICYLGLGVICNHCAPIRTQICYETIVKL